MAYINNNREIQMERGDYFKYPYFINASLDTDPLRYVLTENDKLYFALLEPNQKFEDAILKRVYDCHSEKTKYEDTYIILEPRDTENLLPGKYYYTVKLKTLLDRNEDRYSVITLTPNKEFLLLK